MTGAKIDIAIVGGGVAGAALLADLAARAPAGYRAVIFDPGDVGPGTAYRPQSASLLLNGPVRAMSMVPEDEAHFERWLVDEPSDALICRARYGSYARATAAATLASRRDFEHVRARVIDIEPIPGEGYDLVTADGSRYRASFVTLALGNFAPSGAFLPEALRSFSGYFGDPWRVDVTPFEERDVAIVGSRLTAMDVVALLDERAFRGRLHLVSRHGLLPQVEDPRIRGADPVALEIDASSPYLLLRSMRRAAARYDGDWRAVVDSIRKITPHIWSAWSVRDRKRFLRHAQSMWAIHRYRVPAATFAAFARLNAEGRIIIHRGRITGATANGAHCELQIRSGTQTSRIVAAYVINCTGPNADVTAVDDPLVRTLLSRGLMRPDVLRLGIDADDDYHVRDSAGRAQREIVAIGPLLRGQWYETTAVPEITRQARRIADRLLTGTIARMVAG